MITPKPGLVFTHQRYLTEDRKPPALMRITAVRRGSVFFTYDSSPGNKGAWTLPVDVWIERYGKELT